jgi:tRNA A-37 threonylcarbamoyl transferase component Bud32/tetratricopeptide (TPR) repeat protein
MSVLPAATLSAAAIELPKPNVGRRYVVGAMLGRGGMGEVWQAHDRLTNQAVALKRIRPMRLRVKTEVVNETLRLTQEFRLLASLHHPHVIGVLDYGLDNQGWPFFAMRLLAGGCNVTLAALKQNRAGRRRFIRQLFDGLAYLHRRGVLHRDLKPSNVLVVGEHVYIVDFGLSITATEAAQVEALAGTLQYLAPELLDGALPSERSDLYAAGLLAYEILTGRSAFRSSSRNSLGHAIRTQVPDFTAAEFGDGLGSLLRQLLAKNPAERPQDHAAILALLDALLAAETRPASAAEGIPSRRMAATVAGRDGFARAAPLVGRDRELGELILDLVAALDGNGRSRMVLGMVGSGKTRLIEELRAVALVRGALVVSGRSAPEGALPFAPWRAVLRLLALEQEPDDHAAAVLRPLVPDIELLLGRTVPALPELDAGGTLARLATVITNLLRYQGRTVVLVIEDLHWAGPESIDLFAVIANATNELPLLLLGSARAEEVEDIIGRSGVGTVTTLKALDARALEELAAGTIGQAGRSRALVELVIRESEGNPFFAVEVLRALVERAGGWDKVESAPIPDQLLVGGMRAVVARRLHRLSAEDRRLVEYAAIAGRDLNLTLLSMLVPSADWSGFLHRATEQSLLESRAGAWSFIHEQLRSALIEVIEPMRQRELHGHIAEVLSRVASANSNANANDSAAELTYHWRHAENIVEECRWAARAGEVALNVGAYRPALTFHERVLELLRCHPQELQPIIDATAALRIRFLAGDAAFRAGDFPAALKHLQEVLRSAARPLPASLLGRLPVLIGNLLVQFLHRLPGGSLAWHLSQRRRTQSLLVARTWDLLSRLHIYAGDGIAVLVCALRATNLSEAGGKPLTYAHGILACSAAVAGRWHIAHGYFQRTRSLAAHDPVGLVDVLVMEAVSFLGAARFAETIACLRQARSHAEKAEYSLGQGQALTIEGVCYGYMGDVQRMYEVNREALEAIRHHSHGHQPGFRCGLARALIQLGRFAEARATLERARQLAAPDDRLARALVAASLLLVHLREGDLESAAREDVLLRELMVGVTAIPSPCAQLIEAPAELIIARWHEALQHGDPVGDLPRLAQERWKILASWSGLYAIGWPFAWWFRGHHFFLRARQPEAWIAWEKGRVMAVQLGMPLHEGMLALSLSKHGPRPQQRTHRQRARAVFLSSQAIWHARQIEDYHENDESGSANKSVVFDSASNTRTAAYHIPTKRVEPDRK